MRKFFIFLVWHREPILGLRERLCGHFGGILLQAVKDDLTGLSELAWRGDARACDVYDEDVQVSISPEVAQGSQQPIVGGRPEMCAYLQNTAEDIQLIDAVAITDIKDLVVVQRDFPWTEATVSYTRRLRLLPAKRGPIELRQADTLLIHRGLTGVKIRRVHSVIYRGTELAH